MLVSGFDGAHCKSAQITFDGDLIVTKVNTVNNSFTPGQNKTFTITVTNNSAFGVTDTPVIDLLPTGISVMSATLQSLSANSKSQYYTVGTSKPGELNDNLSLIAGGSAVYAVTVAVPFNYTAPILINEASAVKPAYFNDTNLANNEATATANSTVCYRPAAQGSAPNSVHGITSLNRAGDFQIAGAGGILETRSWPGERRSAHTVLEAKTKGFVLNRVAFTDPDSNPATINDIPTGIAAADFRPGMLVYDTTNNCLKLYDGSRWKCLAQPTCPN